MAKKLENWLKLAKFVEERGVSVATASTYIRRHSEAFEGHIKQTSKRSPLYLDAEAQELLSEVYPLRSATVVEGVPQAEYDELKAKYEGLVANITEMSNLVVEAQRQSAEATQQLLAIQKEHQQLLLENQQITAENNNKNEQIENLKHRNLIQRIFNRDV